MSDTDFLSRENRQLQFAVTELSVLNDIATAISSTQPVEEIVDEIVKRCIKHLGVEEGVVSLLAPEEEQPQIRTRGDGMDGGTTRERASQPYPLFQTMIRRHDSSSEKIPMRLDSRLNGWVMKNRSSLLSNNILEDDRFRFLEADSYHFTSLLCAPLLVKGKLIGYLAVFNKKDGSDFTGEDQRLISIIASQSAQVIENARLYEEEKALIALQEELRMARNIQINLLPKQTPQPSGYELYAVNLPARSVGGDYYDFVHPSPDRLGFCVGDITGKGMPAAMLMANLQATFRSQAMSAGDCCLCMAGTNRLLYLSTESSKFATLFYGVLDPKEGVIEFVNGGHDPALLFRGGEPELLEATGLLLGVVEETSYDKRNIPLGPGELLMLYTDGIAEAMNAGQEEFGVKRLAELGARYRDQPAQVTGQAILDAVKAHAGPTPQSDDITLMLIRRVE